ncbi:MAG TPA: hypothetical protein VHE30_09990 [Polyangiaceae bacterium]|nr:hypothetical protein [Polyangiaceae bacterium]
MAEPDVGGRTEPAAADAGVPGAAEGRAARILSGASALLPLAGLTAIGAAARADTSRWEATLDLCQGAAGVGLACGTAALLLGRRAVPVGPATRRAMLGTLASVAMLLLAQLGALSGAADRVHSTALFERAVQEATYDFPGWNGGANHHGARLFAVEIDPRAEFAKLALRQYQRPHRMLLVGADARHAEGPLTLDLGGCVALTSSGASFRGLTREEALADAMPDASPGAVQPRPTSVAKGEQLDGTLAIFPNDASFERTIALEVRVNGEVVRLSGRWFSALEKRRIAAARELARFRGP